MAKRLSKVKSFFRRRKAARLAKIAAQLREIADRSDVIGRGTVSVLRALADEIEATADHKGSKTDDQSS
jgi:hypothetical protein